MVLPELLRDARARLADANSAASFVVASYTSDQDHKIRQYVSEWQHAVDMCSQAIEDWWVHGELEELTAKQAALRAAKHDYDMALIKARGDDQGAF